MRLSCVFGFLIFLNINIANARTVSVDFNSQTYFDSTNTTAVWNSALGKAHPPIAIDQSTGAGINENNALSLGLGTNGSFEPATYAAFSEGGSTAGNVITINTDTYSVLQFTNFTLASGWTLRGKGSNPLVIKVLGNFTNAGTITCSGDNGESMNTNVAVQPQGGTARCGGGAGGNGGYSGLAATQGSSGCTVPVCNITGGNGGSTQLTDSGGGGGGGGYYSAVAGSNGTGTGPGAGGTSELDALMTKIGAASGGPGGGSGGGGGGYSTTTGPASGAGGGAGGGVIILTVGGNFTNSGSVLANGGNGGTFSAGTERAGGGGGGAGGSVWIQVAGNLDNTGGTITALGGSGGAGVGGGGNGGNGASGRTWLTFGNTFAGNSENPVANLGDLGFVRYSESSYVIQSKSIDARNSSPTFTSFSMTNTSFGTGSATLEVAGSNDNFASDNTGWVLASSPSSLNGKRYFKFRITFQYISSPAVNTTPIATPFEVTAVSANYDGFTQSEFNLAPACGRLGGGPFEVLFLITLLFFMRRLFLERPAKPQINS
ncbi:MAG: hypothetical protein IPM57_05470 [Oligoflexia bacterium]|nr:hypothetical protein [Oligoflexia bacterium]